MRHEQPGLIDDCGAVKNQIAIERARGVETIPLPSAFMFDREQRVQDRTGADAGAADRSRIEEMGCSPTPPTGTVS